MSNQPGYSFQKGAKDMNVFKVSMTEVLEKIHEPLILDRLIRLKLNFQPFLSEKKE